MELSAPAILGQAASGGDTGQFLIWVGALIVAVVIGTVVLLIIRRRMIGRADEDRGGFSTMEEMRAMVARGEMSQEEFDQVRKAMIDKIKAAKTEPQDGGRVSEAGPPDRETRTRPDR
ncbi:MAG: hypothetical protein RIE77_14165 [Phycisphaerales bacterium]